MHKDRPVALFVCVQNAGRSQMAAAFMHQLSGGRVDVRSAGSMPAGQLHPAVVDAMREAGIDLADAYPKPLTDEIVEDADVVITMGCGDACPVFPGKRYVDWQIDDPAGLDAAGVRRVRDEIRERAAGLLAEMEIPAR